MWISEWFIVYGIYIDLCLNYTLYNFTLYILEMGDTNGAKYKRFTYNLNWVKKKSGKKYKKAVERYILILKKQVKEGDSKRVIKTKVRAQARLKKYGIPMIKITDLLEKKGLKDLVKYC